MVENKRDRWLFMLRLAAWASFSLLVVVRRGILAAEKFECDPETATTMPKFFVDDFDCRSFFRCVTTAATGGGGDDDVDVPRQTVARFKCMNGFVFDPCRLKCLWSEECLPSPKIGECDDGDVIIRKDPPPPSPLTSSVDGDVESSKVNRTTTISTASSILEETSEKSSSFVERNHSSIAVDDVAPGVTAAPNENLTTYYVIRVIFKGNFSFGSPTLELVNDTTSFVELVNSTTPSISPADGGSNETSNDTSSVFESRTAEAVLNDTLTPHRLDVAPDFEAGNSSQQPTSTSVDGLTSPGSTDGDGAGMAKDEAANSTMKTIIIDCDRENSKICDNFYSRPAIRRRDGDDFVGRKIAASDDEDEDRENLVEMVHPCLDNVACENGGMFLSMSDGRCGCLCPIGYRGPLCQRQVSRFQCGCRHGGECVRIVERRTNFGLESNESTTTTTAVENSGAEEPENQVSYVCSCPPGIVGPKCQFVLPSATPEAKESVVVGRRSSRIRVEDDLRNFGGTSKFRECQCRNGGTCLVKKTGYVCHCPEGFTGRMCEIRDAT